MLSCIKLIFPIPPYKEQTGTILINLLHPKDDLKTLLYLFRFLTGTQISVFVSSKPLTISGASSNSYRDVGNHSVYVYK